MWSVERGTCARVPDAVLQRSRGTGSGVSSRQCALGILFTGSAHPAHDWTGVCDETTALLRYKVKGRTADRHVIGASPWRSQSHSCEPASERGPGLVGDIVSGASRIPFVRSGRNRRLQSTSSHGCQSRHRYERSPSAQRGSDLDRRRHTVLFRVPRHDGCGGLPDQARTHVNDALLLIGMSFGRRCPPGCTAWFRPAARRRPGRWR